MNVASILMDMLQGNSYGLDWVGKNEAILSSMIPPTTVLKENLSHNSLPENIDSQNLLISGDNIEALKHLQQEYSGKIKMIYIDPPYNTGRAFLYKDKFGDKKDKHSPWLSFMYPRLILAKSLLKEDGVIFVSIDDNAKSQLMLLMADIFGEINFLANLVRKTKSTTNDTKIGMNMQHESTLVFCKNKVEFDLHEHIETINSLAFAENAYMNQHATKELLALGLAEYFTYPKGTNFLKKLIKFTTNDNDFVLDFFAGSGSTGDAIIQLNTETGSNRKFILVQIPDPIDQKKNSKAYNFVVNELKAKPTIFEITKERLIRVAKKQVKNIGFKCLEVVSTKNKDDLDDNTR